MELDITSWWLVLFFTLISITCFYWYSVKKLNYWKHMGVPQVESMPLLGIVSKLFFKPMQDVDVEFHSIYGRIVGYYEGHKPGLSISEPTLLRNVFIKDHHCFTGRRDMTVGEPITDCMISFARGDMYKRIRTLISPAFTTARLKKMHDSMIDCTETFINNLGKIVDNSRYTSVNRLFECFTMDIISRTAFGVTMDSYNDPNDTFITMARNTVSQSIRWRLVMMLLFPRITRLLKIPIIDPKILNFFSEVARKLTEVRRNTPMAYNDFFEILMQATEVQKQNGGGQPNSEDNDVNDVDSNKSTHETEYIHKDCGPLKSMSHDELVGQCLVFFVAGSDTTACTLTLVAYMLALNPDCQDKVVAEIDHVTKKNGEKITYDMIQEMKYLENVILETLRLYPPLVRIERQADCDCTLRDTNIKIKKGMIVGCPVYALHRNSDFYEDPDTFNPDRFSPEERQRRDACTYLAFGVGPRNCIAMRFAILEMKTCIAHMLRRFRLKRCPETKVPLSFGTCNPILHPEDVILHVERRKDSTTYKEIQQGD